MPFMFFDSNASSISVDFDRAPFGLPLWPTRLPAPKVPFAFLPFIKR
jgi:hypothetical protein